jgi:hypothetical protein
MHAGLRALLWSFARMELRLCAANIVFNEPCVCLILLLLLLLPDLRARRWTCARMGPEVCTACFM